jgi:ribokinase
MADSSVGSSAARRAIKDLRFVVVGGYVADCFVVTPRLPAWGDNYQARSVRTSPGGKALNQAVALARLGAQVTAVGSVGEDPFGRDILAALTGEGIEVSFVRTHENAASAICVCFVGDDGQTSFVWHIDDDVAVTAHEVGTAEAAIRSADAVLVTFELPVSAIRETIEVASRHGVRVFVQPAPPLADAAAAASLPWDQVDVLVPNETEARALLKGGKADGLAPNDLAEAVAAELGIPVVVVTLGEAGCVTHAAGTSHRYPARRAAVVDATGAGDAFMATFCAHIVEGTPLAGAVDAAQSAAAWAIGHPGGREAMPSPDPAR